MSKEPSTVEATGLTILVPRVGQLGLDSFLASARSATVGPFSDDRVKLLQEISNRILSDAILRKDPGAAALGFWLRRAHIATLREGFFSGERKSGHRVAAGMVFHIAPGNVDTMFVLSWALSYLAGNANVVRLTSRLTPLTRSLLDVLALVFETHPDAVRGNIFVSYGHDDGLTASFSAACDTRIIWGGDETVRRLRSVPLNPHASERAFASKQSLGVIVSEAYLQADAKARSQLASSMAADIAPFSQFACSSPQSVLWLGSQDAFREANVDFAGRLEVEMAARLGNPDMSWAVRRIAFAYSAAASGQASSIDHRSFTTAVTRNDRAGALDVASCGAGLLTHVCCETVSQIIAKLRIDHQTITYFGLPNAQRDELAVAAGRLGVDRLVPIGQALDFGPFWDGYDLWSDLTRMVVVV